MIQTATTVGMGAIAGYTIITKVVATASSLNKIYQFTSKEGPLNHNEKVQLLAEMFFLVCQSSDFVAKGVGFFKTENTQFLKGIQLLTTGSAGIAHCTKEIIPLYQSDQISQEKWKEISLIFAFRIGEFTSEFASNPVCPPNWCDYVNFTSNVAGCSGFCMYAIKEHHQLRPAGRVIAKWMNNIYERCKRLWITNTSSKPAMIIPEPLNDPKKTPQEHFDAETDKEFAEMMRWKELDYIPHIVAHDPILKQFECSITHQCIRFVVSPVNRHGELDNVFYEKKALMDRYKKPSWLEKSSEKPPCWPSEIKFEACNIADNKQIQFLIDQRLEKIATEWKEELNKKMEKKI